MLPGVNGDRGITMSLLMNVLRRTGAGVNRLGRALAPSDAAWNGATKALLLWIIVLIGVFGFYDMLADFWIGKLLGFLVILGIVLVATLVVQLLYWQFSIQPLSWRLTSLVAVLLGTLYGMALWGPPMGFVPPLVMVLALSLTFGSLAALRATGWRPLRSIPTLVGLGAGLLGLASGVWFIMQPPEDVNPWLETYVFEDRTLDLPNPGAPGDYTIETASYGSGTDRHRGEFAKAATWKTKSVDGSKLVDRWSGAVGWARTKYWGFDAAELPVQGRVWMPKAGEGGKGPFPLVLIVHGNHGMEDFSDPGYAYLGEHFASRGIITVSVDENFLNSSTADIINPLEGGIGPENDARGWMLLKHLQQWRDWNADPKHPLHGQVDMQHIALIGHSRGGEAVAVAAAFNGLKHYPDDATEVFDFGFNLAGVIAIAPVDGQYNPRAKPKALEKINYFVIHGSMDGDVQSFMGLSQGSRVDIRGAGESFKGSYYVEGANHGQFNTRWGRFDYGRPLGWLFNTKDIMDAEEQRQIAKVSFSAFLEVVLKDNRAYLPLLGDPRKGAAWLPDQYILANLVTGGRQLIADYEEDMEVTTTSFAMAEIAAANLTKWREEWASLKWAPLDTHVAVLAWDAEVEQDTASYGFEWTAGSLKLGEDATFVFAAADAGEGTKPKGWESPEGKDEEDEAADAKEDVQEDKPIEPLDWTLVLTDVYGNEARLALSHDAALYPQVKAHTRKLEMFASIENSELVWRRFAFPVRDFMAANPDIQPTALVSLRFEFDKSEAGAIAIDDFGIE